MTAAIKHLLSEGKLSISLAFQTGDCRQTCAELAVNGVTIQPAH